MTRLKLTTDESVDIEFDSIENKLIKITTPSLYGDDTKKLILTVHEKSTDKREAIIILQKSNATDQWSVEYIYNDLFCELR